MFFFWGGGGGNNGCLMNDIVIIFGFQTLCEVQNSVREGLLMFKTHLEELRHNMDCEKHTINTFCQGMQESIAKTHSNMMMEVQR